MSTTRRKLRKDFSTKTGDTAPSSALDVDIPVRKIDISKSYAKMSCKKSGGTTTIIATKTATSTFSKPKVLNKADELFDEIFASSTNSPIESTDKLDPKSKSTAWTKTKSFPETSSLSSLSLSQPSLPITVLPSALENDDKTASASQPSRMKADSVEAIFTAKLKRKIVQSKRFYEEPITQIKCIRSEKEMYTVVRHVKQAHQCLESGEAQQISDDIIYYMDNETRNLPMTYSLSLCTLAQKCTQSNFRAHFRAYGHAKKLFHGLVNVEDDKVLALCASTIFYLLSRDRCSFQVDMEILRLALKYVHLDEKVVNDQKNIDNSEYIKYQKKVLQILRDWHQATSASAGMNRKILFDVTDDNLSITFLIIESFVFVFIRNTAESLKLAMCQLGGLDLIVNKLNDKLVAFLNREDLFSDKNVDHLRIIERCLRILNQVTSDCPKNQAYLIVYGDAKILKVLTTFFNVCLNLLTKASQDFSDNRNESGTSPDAKTILNLCLKVLCNITNLNEIACQKLGSLDSFMIDCITLLTDQIPNHFESDDKFDFSTLTLGLLINLIEPCNSNRKIVISATMPNNQSAIEALAQAFLRHDAAAKVLDEQVDQQIEIFQSQNQIVSSEFEFAQQVQETLESAVGQAGKHMEDTMIAAHIALFFGLILQQNENVAECIKQYLGNRSFEPLVGKLNKLVDFLRLIDSLTSVHENAMFKAIEMLERLSDP